MAFKIVVSHWCKLKATKKLVFKLLALAVKTMHGRIVERLFARSINQTSAHFL